MRETITFSKWRMTDDQIEELGEITAQTAADLTVVCFSNAQREMLATNPDLITGNPSSDDVNQLAMGMIHNKMRELGGNPNEPTRELLLALITDLALLAASWGTPEFIIDHHLNLMKKIIERIATP